MLPWLPLSECWTETLATIYVEKKLFATIYVEKTFLLLLLLFQWLTTVTMVTSMWYKCMCPRRWCNVYVLYVPGIVLPQWLHLQGLLPSHWTSRGLPHWGLNVPTDTWTMSLLHWPLDGTGCQRAVGDTADWALTGLERAPITDWTRAGLRESVPGLFIVLKTWCCV